MLDGDSECISTSAIHWPPDISCNSIVGAYSALITQQENKLAKCIELRTATCSKRQRKGHLWIRCIVLILRSCYQPYAVCFTTCFHQSQPFHPVCDFSEDVPAAVLVVGAAWENNCRLISSSSLVKKQPPLHQNMQGRFS